MVDRKSLLGGIATAYGDRNFRVYSVASIASWLSFFIQLVAVSWLTWELTGSTVWLAAMAALDIVPNVVLMPFTGVFADRVDRHRIMLVTSLLLGIQAALLAVLAWSGLLTVWPLAALVLAHGVLISFMVPAMHGTLPRFVAAEALAPAIAVASSYTQFAIFAGPALAGWIIAVHGIEYAFIANALGYAALLAAFLALRTPPGFEQPVPKPRPILGDIADGFRYLYTTPNFSALLVLVLSTATVTAGFFHMLPAFASDILGVGVSGVSTILAAQGLGATVTAVWLARGGAPVSARMHRILAAALCSCLLVSALAGSSNLYLAAGLALVLGVSREVHRTGTMAVLQLTVTEEQRGRVMGTLFMLSQLAAGLGAFFIGGLAEVYGLRPPTLAAASAGLLVWFYIFLRRKNLIRAVVP